MELATIRYLRRRAESAPAPPKMIRVDDNDRRVSYSGGNPFYGYSSEWVILDSDKLRSVLPPNETAILTEKVGAYFTFEFFGECRKIIFSPPLRLIADTFGHTGPELALEFIGSRLSSTVAIAVDDGPETQWSIERQDGVAATSADYFVGKLSLQDLSCGRHIAKVKNAGSQEGADSSQSQLIFNSYMYNDPSVTNCTSSSSDPTAATAQASTLAGKNNSNVGKTAGMAVAGLTALIVLSLILFNVFRRRGKQKDAQFRGPSVEPIAPNHHRRLSEAVSNYYANLTTRPDQSTSSLNFKKIEAVVVEPMHDPPPMMWGHEWRPSSTRSSLISPPRTPPRQSYTPKIVTDLAPSPPPSVHHKHVGFHEPTPLRDEYHYQARPSIEDFRGRSRQLLAVAPVSQMRPKTSPGLLQPPPRSVSGPRPGPFRSSPTSAKHGATARPQTASAVEHFGGLGSAMLRVERPLSSFISHPDPCGEMERLEDVPMAKDDPEKSERLPPGYPSRPPKSPLRSGRAEEGAIKAGPVWANYVYDKTEERAMWAKPSMESAASSKEVLDSVDVTRRGNADSDVPQDVGEVDDGGTLNSRWSQNSGASGASTLV